MASGVSYTRLLRPPANSNALKFDFLLMLTGSYGSVTASHDRQPLTESTDPVKDIFGRWVRACPPTRASTSGIHPMVSKT